MKLTPLSNRSGAPGDDWYHLIPLGEYPHADSGLLQVLDPSALQAIVNRFNQEAAGPHFGGLILDQEHWSYDAERSSQAFGWIRQLENRADGVWGKVELTDLGKTALENKRYKYVSPAFLPKDVERLGNNRVRPLRLDSAGLTNSPNLRGMVPLTNRAGELPADNKKGHTMKSVATALGLSAEASEEAILAGVNALKNRAETAERELGPIKNRVTELETESKKRKEEQIEEDLKPLLNRAKPEVVASFRASLVANRDTGLPGLKAFIATLDGKSSGKPLVNRAAAGHPQEPGDEETPDTAKAEKRAAAIRNRASEIQRTEKVSYNQAWATASREIPA